MMEGVGGCGTQCLQESVTPDHRPHHCLILPLPMAVEKYPGNLVAQSPLKQKYTNIFVMFMVH